MITTQNYQSWIGNTAPTSATYGDFRRWAPSASSQTPGVVNPYYRTQHSGQANLADWGDVGKHAVKGAGAGAAVGATVGNLVPVIGTAIGAGVGAVVGGVGGAGYGVYDKYAHNGRRKSRAKAAQIAATRAQDTAVTDARQMTDYFNAVDPTSRAAQYGRDRMVNLQAFATPEELMAISAQEERDKAQKALSGRVDDYFADGSRQTEYDQLINNRLTADTQQIEQAYGDATTGAGLDAARQGLLGGSVAAENQAELGGQRSAALVGAAQNANQTQSNLTARERQMQDQLLSLVNSDDPYMRQAANAQLQNLQQMSATDAYMNAAQQQRTDSNQFTQNQLSQSIGGGLSGIAGLIRQDPNRGSLSGWYTPARN